MTHSRVASLLSSHLGLSAHDAGLVSTRRFRSIVVTHHQTPPAPWRWPSSPPPSPHAAVVFATDGASLPTGPTTTIRPAPIGCVLPSDAAETVSWTSGAEALVLWVPELLLSEFTDGTRPPTTPLVSSPLTVGFRTFAHSVLRHNDEGSSMSRYAIERLLAEMTFGSLVEQQSVEAERRPSSLIERARTVILMRREDAGFSTSQLAAELHVSPRQLQRAFAAIGETPGDLLRRMRAELAESMLRNPLYASLTVDEVSQFSGFTSSLQMRRALHAADVPTPTELRRAVGTPKTVT
ncbi:helix-turn-helix domain-containing protein [Microbacterium esteraromaticum]|uniref:helix-turn-helix domain-containing protein n=1 Tax=Microbacterium esteraromaticum TaxID=57043 RepID=UPI001CD47D10|nr:helix-turn-helix domain-containing protein [Microbacterium esteraromaticum]MCA1305506.1 helix-turn-helix domain-containing protein [Microbacterium esteraromaticum]